MLKILRSTFWQSLKKKANVKLIPIKGYIPGAAHTLIPSHSETTGKQ